MKGLSGNALLEGRERREGGEVIASLRRKSLLTAQCEGEGLLPRELLVLEICKHTIRLSQNIPV